jgi:hypothetical protein
MAYLVRFVTYHRLDVEYLTRTMLCVLGKLLHDLL